MTNAQFKPDNFQSLPPETPETFDEVPRKIPKFLKWMAGTAVGLVILVVGGGVVATQIIDQQKYKSLIVSKVEETTGYKVDWDGNIALGLMPLPHASVKNLQVKSENETVLTVDSAEMQIALLSLINQKIEIRKVVLTAPVVTLATNKDGQKLWVVEPTAGRAQSAEETPQSAASQSPMNVVVNRVDIRNGKFVIDNRQSGAHQEFQNLNLSLLADSLKGPFDLKADTLWKGQVIEVKATSGEIDLSEGSYPIQTTVKLPKAGTVLTFSGVVDGKSMSARGDVTVETDKLSSALMSFNGADPSLPEGLDGKASLAGKLVYTSDYVAFDEIAASVGSIGFAGKISAEGLSDGQIPQLSFNLTPSSKAAGQGSGSSQLVRILSDLSVAAKGSMENDKIRISSAHIKTLGNDISVSGITSTGLKPELDIVVNGSDINLDRLSSAAPSSSADSSLGGVGAKQAGFDLPFSGRIQADITKLVTGGRTYSGIKTDIIASGSSLNISGGAVTLPQSTTISTNGKIGNTSDMSGLDLKINARADDVESLMSSYNIKPPELSRKIGAASVIGHVTGDLKTLDFNATVAAMGFNMTGQGRVANPLNELEINALKFSIRHPDFNQAMKIGRPGFDGSSGFSGALDLSGNVSWGKDQYTITSLSGKLGQTTLAGNIKAITKPKTSVTGNIELGSIVLPSATTTGNSGAANGSVSASSIKGERWSREAIDTSWMRSFDADLKVKARSITQNMWKLNDANFDFKLNDGVLTLNDVSAGLFGGRAVVNGVIKNGSGAKDPLSISVKLDANNVDAQELMSAATGKMSHTLSGTLSKVDVTVNATGSSPYALVQTLGGNGSINGRNIVVQGIDAAKLAATAKGSYKPLERAGSLFQTFQSGQTEFSVFESAFVITNGVVNFSKIYFDGAKATLNSTGSVNLPAWSVDLKNAMTVKDSDIPSFDFSIRGSLDHPLNSGGDIINNYLRKKLEKKATQFIEDKLNGKLGDKLDKFLGAGASALPEGTGADGTSVAPATKPDIKQEAAKEAVKALQGLFGK